jgi:integrase/recombinase XerD
MKQTDLAVHLTAFLSKYLPAQRNVSANTVRAYRDTFTLLLRYCRDDRGIAPDRLRIDQLDAPFVIAFLEHLEKQRDCSPRTRNHRLAALRSFFHYLQTEDPARLAQCQRILAIPAKRHQQRLISYLQPDDVAALLAQPDQSRPRGRRDVTLLSLLYDTGARIQELLDLRVKDVRLEHPAVVRLVGKGRKLRAVPLMARTADLVRRFVTDRGLDHVARAEERLFQSRNGGPLSRSGVRHLLNRYADRARRERTHMVANFGPHVLRHSKAMHLLQAGIAPIIIRDILGHVDVRTTEIYARVELETKRRALEAMNPTNPPISTPSWQSQKGLLEWLHSL